MAAPETGGSTTVRSDHSNRHEAEENDLKNNFMKEIEALKEEMNFIKENRKCPSSKSLETLDI